MVDYCPRPQVAVTRTKRTAHANSNIMSTLYKAFVSSTYIDLKEHRAHVIRALRKAGILVDPMEDWTADSHAPKRFSQDRVQGCHFCVLLVAFRRGFIPENETVRLCWLLTGSTRSR